MQPMTWIVAQQVLSGLVAVILVLAHGSAFGYDFNRTLIHYFLTSSQNSRLELERTRAMLATILQEDWEKTLSTEPDSEQGAAPQTTPSRSGPEPASDQPATPALPSTVSDLHVAFLRGDYLIPGKKDDHTFAFGTIAYGSRDFHPFPYALISFYGGFTFFDILERDSNQEVKSTAMFFNFLGGFEAGYGSWVGLEMNVSGNGLLVEKPKEETFWDFDQAGFRLSLPFLGPYGTLQYDLGDARPRDLEIGWIYSLRRFGAGVLTVAYHSRFRYPVTGIAVRDDLPEDERFDIPGDHSGVLRWERIAPFGPQVEVHLWTAFGNVPDGVRIAWLGTSVYPRGLMFGFFARGGTAYSRLDRRRFFGGSGGLEVRWSHGNVPVQVQKKVTEVPIIFALRAGVGYRDPDTVDRLGDVGKATLSGTFQVAF